MTLNSASLHNDCISNFDPAQHQDDANLSFNNKNRNDASHNIDHYLSNVVHTSLSCGNHFLPCIGENTHIIYGTTNSCLTSTTRIETVSLTTITVDTTMLQVASKIIATESTITHNSAYDGNVPNNACDVTYIEEDNNGDDDSASHVDDADSNHVENGAFHKTTLTTCIMLTTTIEPNHQR